eukprot:gene34557-biopygen19280
MPLSTYYENFLNALEDLQTQGVDAPPDDDQVADFYNGLDQSRYSEMLAYLTNHQLANPLDNIFPATLDRAYHYASQFK